MAFFRKDENVGPPITLVGAQSNGLAKSQEAVMTIPGGGVVGDLAIMFIASIGGWPTIRDNWTRVLGAGDLICYIKKFTVPTSTVSIASDSFVRAATILVYRGADAVVSASSGAGSGPYQLPGVDVGMTNSRFINVVCDKNPMKATPDPRQTVRGSYVSTTYHGLVVSDEVVTKTGNTGPRTMTTSVSGGQGGSCMSVLVR